MREPFSAANPAHLAYEGRGRRRDRLVVMLFMACLSLPMLGLAAGLRPENLEKRQLATMPPFQVGSLLDRSYYAAIDSAISDNFPLRTDAVSAVQAVEYAVFHSLTPRAHVVVGVGDWLFYEQEMFPQCQRNADEELALIDRLASEFAKLGKTFRMVIVPDKRSVYPEMVNPSLRLGSCTDAARPDMEAGMAARPDTTLNLWQAMREAKASLTTGTLYYHQDTHWNAAGLMVGVQALVDASAPGVWDPSAVVPAGTQDHVGDLTQLMGLPTIEKGPRVSIQRQESISRETLVADPSGGADGDTFSTDLVSVTGTQPLIPGRTLVIHDSMFGAPDLIAPWFSQSIWLHITVLTEHPEVVANLPDYDSVVLEQVERGAYQMPYDQLLAPLTTRPNP